MQINRHIKKSFVLLFGLFLNSMAHASLNLYSCTDPIYGVSGSGGYGTYYTSGSCIGGHTANANSTLVTSTAILQAAAYQVSDLITARLAHLRNPENQLLASADTLLGSGVSTGDTFGGVAAWVNGSWTKIKNDFPSTLFDGHVGTAMVGVDTILNHYNVVLGLALGWEDQSITTNFNGGHQDATGWSITPYAAYLFDPNWSFSLFGGYASLDYDLDRRDPATLGFITGSADADRWYIGGDLNLHIQRDPVRFNGYMGLLHMSEDRDAYAETGAQTVTQPSQTTDISRFRLGGTLGYMVDRMLEPYVKAALLWDFNQTNILVAPSQFLPADSSTAMVLGAGLNFYFSQNIYLNLEGYSEVFRDNYDKYGVTGTILVNFG